MHTLEESAASFATGVALGILLGVIAYKYRYLDGRATVVSVVFSGLYFMGGVGLYMASLTFFFSSSAVTRLAYSSKKIKGSAEREEGRSASQVIGAGSIAAILAAMYGILPDYRGRLLLPALAALAASNADTWAAEIGALYPGKPRLITRLKVKVEPGTSGGVTPLGSLGALVGSSLIGLIVLVENSLGLLHTSQVVVPYIVVLGWLGEVLDSLIGASLQVKYFCSRCQTLTDKPVHLCGEKTMKIGGLDWVSNETTNLLATGITALLGLVLSHFIIAG
ncbi:DUF92 domain-containing protein [Infirmifilum lucidum]|uniref:DUF92 domain-containing protein n=1 Tax=Infirmifilum lucidum TaxID=2776706 RepID=A0A7L9FIQ1_9CREN|nr:DUF92 domain-containing protein [Infirmifilum lucidum]QOJ79511.1 DUF92 domain-containing protein [Infirmifilum lucidum]